MNAEQIALYAAGIVGASKVGCKLIDKISEALGIVIEPWSIKRKKLAEYEAEVEINKQKDHELALATTGKKILLPGGISEEMAHRALLRLVSEECKKQENMERILGIAIENLPDSARPEEIDDDWLSLYFESCRMFSGEEMQKIWGKILVKEAIEAKTISRQTINIMATMGVQEVDFFSKLLSFTASISAEDGGCELLIYDSGFIPDTFYYNNGITLSFIHNLQAIGLVSLSSSEIKRKIQNKKSVFIKYGEKIINLDSDDTSAFDEFDQGHVLLTRAGRELSNICSFQQNVPGFIEFLAERYRKKFTISIREILNESSSRQQVYVK